MRLPFEDALVSKLFRDIFRNDDETTSFSSAFIPPCDIAETAENLSVTMELPGFTKDQVAIEVNANVLTIKGERKQEKEENGKFHRQERMYGSFERSFTLPSTAMAENIKAGFVDGVLTLTIPKQEVAKPRRVPIG
jgi:HSP20 family protein